MDTQDARASKYEAGPNTYEFAVQMDLNECWARLEATEFGRLAFRLIDEVHIVPLNYLVAGRSLVFRTDPGHKLFAAALGTNAALEIDHYDAESAWSVVARGALRRLTEGERHRLGDLPSQPWVGPAVRAEAVELRPDVVTGRRFHRER